MNDRQSRLIEIGAKWGESKEVASSQPDFQRFDLQREEFPYITKYGDSSPDYNTETARYKLEFRMPVFLFWYDKKHTYYRFNVTNDAWIEMYGHLPKKEGMQKIEAEMARLERNTKKHDEFIQSAAEYDSIGYLSHINSPHHFRTLPAILFFIGSIFALYAGSKFIY